jgi:hypothetical protein
MGELAGRPADPPDQQGELASGREQSLLRPEMEWRQPWVSLMKPGRRPAIHFRG